ncbi:CLUMA_CG008887, isoform A [Clunio marinus]|uniref:CLUMA_CG008887, isoform A n=1 Tax=Clunio marinus TaxID=568069 RepID=A0A1J1IA97_9DIPT|nr:CLUMA_CG008887, isoform A [Clunio marinus]
MLTGSQKELFSELFVIEGKGRKKEKLEENEDRKMFLQTDYPLQVKIRENLAYDGKNGKTMENE